MRDIKTPNPTYAHYHKAAKVWFQALTYDELLRNVQVHMGESRHFMDSVVREVQFLHKDHVVKEPGRYKIIKVGYQYFRHRGRLLMSARIIYDFPWKEDSMFHGWVRTSTDVYGGHPYNDLVDPRPAIVQFFFDIKEEKRLVLIPHF